MIKLKDMTKYYRNRNVKTLIFENINIDINTDLAIIGRNGCGKSTLLNIIGGIDKPTSGKIITDCTISWPFGRPYGFQGSLTARENVTFVSKIYYGNDKDKIKDTIQKAKSFAELGRYFDRPINTYSAGMRARIAFALSTTFDFDIYLFDEVNAAGDEIFKKKCIKEIENLKKNKKFIMVSHNLNELKRLCEKAILIKDKKIQFYESVEEAIYVYKNNN